MATSDKPSLANFETEFAQANSLQARSPLVAFYVKNYIITKTVEFLKAERAQGKDVSELTKCVQLWFKDLEELKGSLASKIPTQEQSKKQFHDFTYNLFSNCDAQYKNGQYSQQLADEFSSVILLFNAFSIFNSPTQEMEDHKNYAKTTLNNVTKALQATNFSKPLNASKLPQTGPTQGYNASQTPYGQNVPDPSKAFDGFNVAQSVFVSKEALDQTRSSNIKGQPSNIPGNNPLPGTTTTSVFQQGLPQNFHGQSQAGQNTMGMGTSIRGFEQKQGGVNTLPDFNKFGDNNNQAIPPNDQFGGNMPNTGNPYHPFASQQGLGGNQKADTASSSIRGGLPNPTHKAPQEPSSYPAPQINKGVTKTNEPSKVVGPKPGGIINLPSEKSAALKELCMMTISELDYRNVNEARENIKKALSILREYDPSI